MKRKYLFIICMLAIIGISIIIHILIHEKYTKTNSAGFKYSPEYRMWLQEYRQQENGELFNIDFEFVGSSDYDPTYFYKKSIKQNTPITRWDILSEKKYALKLAKEQKFTLPKGFDYNNYTLIISYGRKIFELESEEIYKYGPPIYYNLIITWEEEHRGNQVFFYKIKKRIYSIFDLYCYIMNGNEKVYAGAGMESFLNEYNDDIPTDYPPT